MSKFAICGEALFLLCLSTFVVVYILSLRVRRYEARPYPRIPSNALWPSLVSLKLLIVLQCFTQTSKNQGSHQCSPVMDGRVPISHFDAPISTSGLISSLYQTYTEDDVKARNIDSSSIIVFNGDVPSFFLHTIWQHGYKQTEDELVLLMPTHDAATSLICTSLSRFPGFNTQLMSVFTVLMPFLTAMTPTNLNQRYHAGLELSCSLNSSGQIISTRLAMSERPFVSLEPLINLTPEKGFRSFNVFYCLLSSQQNVAEFIDLKEGPSEYDLLRKSETFKLPEWMAYTDDEALAKDWDEAMSLCLTKDFRRIVMTTLSGILLMGNNDAEDQANGAALMGLDPILSREYSTTNCMASAYVMLVNAVILQLNNYLAKFDLQDHGEGDINTDEICSVIKLVECSSYSKLAVLKSVFDDRIGLNAEMLQNGLPIPKSPPAVLKAIDALSQTPSPDCKFVDFSTIVDTSVAWVEETTSYLRNKCTPLNLEASLPSNRIWTVLGLASAANAKAVADGAWSSSLVSSQVRGYFIAEWAARRAKCDYTADYGVGEFVDWFNALLPCGQDHFRLEQWAESRGYSAEQFFCGKHRIYVSEAVWREIENEREHYTGRDPLLRLRTNESKSIVSYLDSPPYQKNAPQSWIDTTTVYNESPHVGYNETFNEMVRSPQSAAAEPVREPYSPYEYSDYDENDFLQNYKDEENTGQHLEVYLQSRERILWVAFVWFCTWWIPSPLLKWVGRMKRADVRLAWREKVVLFGLITFLNLAVIFYMIVLGRLICPDYDHVWNHKELHYHQGANDYYAGIHGKVYDMTKFYKIQHSDNGIKTTPDLMLQFAGKDLSDYFPPPLTIACPGLVKDESVKLQYNTTLVEYSSIAMHTSGSYLVPNENTKLHEYSWYNNVLQPGLRKYYKGRIVETRQKVEDICNNEGKYLFIIDQKIYDVTNYMITATIFPKSDAKAYEKYSFFPEDVEQIFENYQGMDASEKWKTIDEPLRKKSLECLNSAFLYGELDFRHSAKCQTANIILLVIAGILTSITVVKFLASLRIGVKPLPSPQNRFVVCQIPVYTESEEEVRLAIDSLTNLNYDNQKKLLFIVCDGIVVGAGNDRPTPQIVLDILGVEDRTDPMPRAYHAIAEGAKELNYAKVFSGLYENEGDVVPYIVLVKCGAPTETHRPGNRGKRDSQLILLNFFNRVQHQAPMTPLELEIFHHINNIIGIEPERYDYLFTVDADTCVAPDALTRLVAECTCDSRIAAVCGETSLQNEQESLSTMVQVYEYFISHHLTKAFESLFGSVTCLPGCFSLFRLRTAQLGKPLIISDKVIKDYSLRHVNTLHKKNLFSLGEDRYLTTLMSKHFPKMKLRFVADAKCKTKVPSDVSVLLSQRRRWINSTVHNLFELLNLDSMCGFCLFSMRGVVFVDLVGTLMLPSVVVYLVYLIYIIASKSTPLPLISIILIASVYGLQACVFILHREWQHIFWMIIYIAAYPFHSFLLPIYAFWNMDNFSWGNTRVVLDESKGKMVVLQDDNDVFDIRSIPYETWQSYSLREMLPGADRPIVFHDRRGRVVFETFGSSVHDVNDSHHGTLPRPHVSSRSSAIVEEIFDHDTIAQIRTATSQTLRKTDLNNTTSYDLRSKIAELLGLDLNAEEAAIVDQIIDSELENMDEEVIDDLDHDNTCDQYQENLNMSNFVVRSNKD